MTEEDLIEKALQSASGDGTCPRDYQRAQTLAMIATAQELRLLRQMFEPLTTDVSMISSYLYQLTQRV